MNDAAEGAAIIAALSALEQLLDFIEQRLSRGSNAMTPVERKKASAITESLQERAQKVLDSLPKQ